MAADDPIANFCAYLQRRNYSPHTVDNYGRDLRLFFQRVDKAPCTGHCQLNAKNCTSVQ
jgi:site-specific recombinase XerD